MGPGAAVGRIDALSSNPGNLLLLLCYKVLAKTHHWKESQNSSVRRESRFSRGYVSGSRGRRGQAGTLVLGTAVRTVLCSPLSLFINTTRPMVISDETDLSIAFGVPGRQGGTAQVPGVVGL